MQQNALGDKHSTQFHSVKKGKVNTVLNRLRRDKYLYLLAVPGILYFLIFKYIPIGGVIIAFQEYSPFKGILHSKWVGFENFERFFRSSEFMKLLRNTMVISILNLVFSSLHPSFFLCFSMKQETASSKKRSKASYIYHISFPG